ncbi:Methyl-CpG binding transcription regulator [Handroanthus impetiginosus]|uniref:Methyl-CpG binding transcription regulator n=1 Tax=Handroanthus impetiginosus TaxID=429701 RepID=A0A2G9I3M9_9LAMI|nr:Methyl-CpG binding transcription regulator [Handroanthus impetiginosus]
MERCHNSTSSPEKSMLVPYARRQLAVAPQPITTASGFSLPLGWGVEEVPRRDGVRSDMYYYEPGTGKKFRSIREVNRHLKGEVYRRRSTRKLSIDNHKSEYRKMVVSGGKLLKLDNELSKNDLAMVTSGNAISSAPTVLPDGWIVEEVPRRCSNWTDKYYYEPGMGQKFRSLVAVERYLEELDDDAPLSKALEEIKENKPLAKIFKLENHNKNSTPREKNVSQENTEASSFDSPPMKVNWVLASPQGDAWNPFIYETLVPEAAKQQWTNRFMLFMNEGESDFQSS